MSTKRRLSITKGPESLFWYSLRPISVTRKPNGVGRKLLLLHDPRPDPCPFYPLIQCREFPERR